MAIQSSAALQTLLNRIHRKSYPAYKETKGIYQFDRYVLSTVSYTHLDVYKRQARLNKCCHKPFLNTL